MNGKPFLDTNILIYAFSSEDPRGPIAKSLLETGGTISVQVLNEFVNVSRNKVRVSWVKIEKALAIVKRLLAPPVPLTLKLHETAIALARDHNLAIYDSLIVAAAIHAGSGVLYTEDVQHGRRIGNVTIRNPFLGL